MSSTYLKYPIILAVDFSHEYFCRVAQTFLDQFVLYFCAEVATVVEYPFIFISS